MKPAEAIKQWNPKLYYEILAWKDRNMKKFQQLADCDSLNDCKPEELAALTILLINEVTERFKHTKLPES